MRVLMLVQQVDEHDWLRAFILDWVRGLAVHVKRLDVITLELGQAALSSNVFVQSMGKEYGRNRLRELLAFHRAMRDVIRDVDVVFSHMTPLYTLVAAPYCALYRKPQVLWYTHRHASFKLRLALALSWRVVTAAPDSFPIPSEKVRVLGHGINTDFYAPKTGGDSQDEAGLPYVVYVARLMPIKHQETLLRAIASGIDAHAVLVGGVPDGQDSGYMNSLKGLTAELDIAEKVTFTGGLPASAVRDWYGRAAVAVNLSPPGLFDKAVLESMASGVPTIVSSAAFDALLGDCAPQLRIDSPQDVDGLARRLRDLLGLDEGERAAMTMPIRERVRAAHSLERLIPRLVKIFRTGEP